MEPFKNLTQLARELRKNQTPSEIFLWKVLRNRKFLGYKFLRQHPVVYKTVNKKLFFFVPDFYCAEKELVIELDGKIHDLQKEYDEQRDLILKIKGLKILRIKNSELNNIENVKRKIEEALNNS